MARQTLEARGDTEYRAMHCHVELVETKTAAPRLLPGEFATCVGTPNGITHGQILRGSTTNTELP